MSCMCDQKSGDCEHDSRCVHWEVAAMFVGHTLFWETKFSEAPGLSLTSISEQSK